MSNHHTRIADTPVLVVYHRTRDGALIDHIRTILPDGTTKTFGTTVVDRQTTGLDINQLEADLISEILRSE